MQCGGLLIFVVFSLLMSFACSKARPEDQAAKAALEFYQLLLEGKTPDFLSGKSLADTLPAGRRLQQTLAHEQYLKDITVKHGGLCGVALSANPPRYDSIAATEPSDRLVYAFLLLSFNDSTQEEISVPMVLVNGEWKMK